jgi:hypothetical protein
MKKWKITIEHNNQIKEIIASGERYSDVYIDTKVGYTGCIILDIIEILPAHVSNDIALN